MMRTLAPVEPLTIDLAWCEREARRLRLPLTADDAINAYDRARDGCGHDVGGRIVAAKPKLERLQEELGR